MTWRGFHLSYNTWSKIAIKVPSIFSGDWETLPSSSHLSWWNFHPFWSKVFRSCGHSCRLHAVKLPCSITCRVLHRAGCAMPSSGVNLQSAWDTQHWTCCALHLLCTALLFPTARVQLLKELLWAALSSCWEQRDSKDNHGWGRSITKMWEQELAARGLWADSNKLWIGV